MLDTEAPGRAAPPRRRPRRTGRILALLGGLAVLAVGAAFALHRGGGDGHRVTAAPPTADVVRADLSDRTKVDGTLGYADSYTVLSGGTGRLTWLPDVGDEIRRGQRVYGLNGHRVPLFYGGTPFWRPLRSGMDDGRDVLELERNLAALGYGDGMTVDDHFSAATKAAVEDWQDDMGMSETGVVQPDDVVMEPGAIRVTALRGTAGGHAGGPLLTATGADRQITVNVPVSEQEIARKGAQVTVELPGGTTATGHITKVGTVATAGATDAQSQTGQGTENATIPVYVKLDKPSVAGRFDGAPVTVGFTATLHKGVLAVPVNALLATADGRYSVNVADAAGKVRAVPVTLGIFDDDQVEVTGALTPGMKVQVPRS
jgi:peptidoglycan hydrolase-like protein with peptidoglycan-binding domain